MRAWILVVCVLVMVGCVGRKEMGVGADFVVGGEAVGPGWVGFGAQMNPYLYAWPNWPAEVNEGNVGELERKVRELRPQFVRVFFLNSWWEKDTDSSIAKGRGGMKQSFIRTVRLAQEAGAAVLVQFWYDPAGYEDIDGAMGRFAKAIAEMRGEHGLTAIKYATIQNEPNGGHDSMSKEKFVRFNLAFDRAMKEAGIRGEVKLIAGDLLEDRQGEWYGLLEKELAEVCDGYSMHAYWDYWDIEKLMRRVRGSMGYVRAMEEGKRRPMYVTEFGARGFRERPGVEPGKSTDGRPVAEDPIYTFEIAIFMLEALNFGYGGTIQWDMYDAWYDRKMGYGVIGAAETGWKEKPGYGLLKLFTHNVVPGWRARKVEGYVEDVWVSAVGGKEGRVVFVVNRGEPKEVSVGGFRGGAELRCSVWNGEGEGKVTEGAGVRVDGEGVVRVKVGRDSLMVVKG